MKRLTINFHFTSEDEELNRERLAELANIMLESIQDSIDSREIIIKSFNLKVIEDQ